MIVPADTPASPTKSNGQSDSPPAYQYRGYSSIPQGSTVPVPPSMATTSTPIFIKHPSGQRRGGACWRFVTAFAIAILVYLLLAALFGSMAWRPGFGGGDGSSHWGEVNPEWPEYPAFRGNWEIIDDGCSTSWSETSGLLATDIAVFPDIDIDFPDWAIDFNAPYHAHTSRSISADAMKQLVVGYRTFGSIDFATSSSKEQTDIRVDIIASYHRQSALNQVRICKLKSKNGGEGVGLYMPRHLVNWHTEDQVSFRVTVTFPVAASRSVENPLVINEFETHFSIFRHNLGYLYDKIFFKNLVLRTSNARINAEGVNFDHSNIRTSNGAITGKYQVNDTLVLETSNGRIDVELEVEDSGRRIDGADVVLRTSNAALTASANLYATHHAQEKPSFRSAKNGRFSLDARTSNGHLNVNVPTIPFDSALKLTGRTSNSPVDVVLDKRGSYEGTYKAETSSYMGMPSVERADAGDERDGQRRVLQRLIGGKGSLRGQVFWGRWDNGRDGSVEVKTSNSQIHLHV